MNAQIRNRSRADGRSIADVLVDIGRDIQDIMRAEIRLAQWEVRERVQSAGWLIATGVIGSFLSAFFVLFAVHYGLRVFMPPWAAALCVAVAMAVVAFVAFKVGVARLTKRSAGHVKAGHIKENLQWTRPQTK